MPPKLLALAADRATLGQLAETFVFQELRRQASWYPEDVRFHYYRDKDRSEVDIVLDRGGRGLFGIEVKVAASVGNDDFRGLRKLRAAARDRSVAGVVLYDGETTLGFGDALHAVPIRASWETP